LGAGEEVRAVPTERGAWATFYTELAAALRTGGPLPVDPNDSVSALEIIEAAQRSARDGVVVALGG
jgi:predicted dehydrogenase